MAAAVPVIVEIPSDMWNEEVPEPLNYTPVLRTRYGADPVHVKEAAALLMSAKRPVIYAGQGVHYAKAWPQLKRLAERLAIPVCTSLGGKSSFPETHPLSLGSGGLADAARGAEVSCRGGRDFRYRLLLHRNLVRRSPCPRARPSFIRRSIPRTSTRTSKPKSDWSAMPASCSTRCWRKSARASAPIVTPQSVAAEIAASHKEWLAKWMPKLTSNDAPFNPYRVLWDLQHTVDIKNTIITHDAGSPRDQLSPFWKAVEPLSYIGWGKTTQLGYGLGLAMGAKLAKPDKLCINVWGDAAIGFTGMDFETAVRERIPIMSILLNNFSMAIELKVMPISTEKYRSTDISGDYAAMARAFGGYGERVTKPEDIIPAIKRGIAKTREGIPVLLEFITSKETEVSRSGT